MAALFFRNHEINRLPVEPSDIISKHKNWRAKTYDAYAQRHGVTIEDVIEWADSADGCVQYYTGKQRFLILYNTNPFWIDTPSRIRWTLMHEIGHIVLGHLEEIEESKITRNILSKEKYAQLEKEAHFFAACVLAPHIVLNNCIIENSSDIVNICKISKEAADKRFTAYKKWNTRVKRYNKISKEDLLVFLQFKPFIFCRKCVHCGHGLKSNKAKFCPICGETLIWGEGNLIYDGFDLDENGRAIQCPRCENEQVAEYDEDYCNVCGAYLINRCSDDIDEDINGNEILLREGCGTIAAGYARFCTNCGRPTTFFIDGLLDEWKISRTIIRDEVAAAAMIDDDSEPF